MNNIRKSIFYLQQAIRDNQYEGTEKNALKILDDLIAICPTICCLTCKFDDGNLNFCEFHKTCSPLTHTNWKKKEDAIKYEDLYKIFIEGKIDGDFEFIGDDNNVYLFDACAFTYLLEEYGKRDVIELMHGGIEVMIDNGICKLKNPITEEI